MCSFLEGEILFHIIRVGFNGPSHMEQRIFIILPETICSGSSKIRQQWDFKQQTTDCTEI